MNQFPSRWAITGIILFAASAELAEGVIQDESKPIDCGVNALFLLLDLEGRTVTLDRLESTLPPPHPEGYSMAELAQTSAGLGLSLDGIRYGKGDRALTRPAIAFLRGPRGGHYVVLRPVGEMGTRIQVLDPPSLPGILEYDQLFKSKEWTGSLLLARIPWYSRYRWSLLTTSVTMLFFLATSRYWKRTSSVG